MQWFLATILQDSNIVKFTTLFTNRFHMHTEVASEVASYKRLSWTGDCFKIDWQGSRNKNALGGKFLKN